MPSPETEKIETAGDTLTTAEVIALAGRGAKLPSTEVQIIEPSRKTDGTFEVPRSYALCENGTFLVNKPFSEDDELPSIDHPAPLDQDLTEIAPRPLWTTRTGVDADGRSHVELAFVDACDNRRRLWVPREKLVTSNGLASLAAFGVPVDGPRAKLSTYLGKALALNSRTLPHVRIVRRQGGLAHADGFGWLLGSSWIGPEAVSAHADSAIESYAAAYRTSGDRDAWFEWLREIYEYGDKSNDGRLGRWLSMTAFLAPLLRLLHQRTVVVHHFFDDEGGKSALARFGASTFGDPRVLYDTSAHVSTQIGTIFSTVDDLPLFFAAHARTEKKNDLVTNIYSAMANLRAVTPSKSIVPNIQGEHLVVRLNGAAAISAWSLEEQRRQDQRTFQIHGRALPSFVAQRLHIFLDNDSFGWGGHEFVQRLCTELNSAGQQLYSHELCRRRNEIVEQLQCAIPDEPILRILTTEQWGILGAVVLTHTLVASWLLRMDETAAHGHAILDALAIARNIAARASTTRVVTWEYGLQLIRDHFYANAQSQWYDIDSAMDAENVSKLRYNQLFGVIRKASNEVIVLATPCNDYLEKHGISKYSFWSDLRERGFLVRTDIGDNAPKVKIGRFRPRAYILKYDRLLEHVESSYDAAGVTAVEPKRMDDE